MTLRCHHHTVQLVSSDRQRKDELEQRMSSLQESRRELMVQLEQLMMLLKVPQTCLSSLSLHRSHIQMKSPSWLLKEDKSLWGTKVVFFFFFYLPSINYVAVQVCMLIRYHTGMYFALACFPLYIDAGGRQYSPMMNVACNTLPPSCGWSLQLM